MAEIWGGSGNDSLVGSGANDDIAGFNGNDTLIGGGGEDSFEGGLGNDLIVGGAGVNDWAYYDEALSRIILNLSTGLVTGGLGSDTISGVENIVGTDFDDVMTGNASNNNLQGIDGNDTLSGGAGNDFISGGLGVDSMDGGTGLDTVFYEDVAGGISLDLEAGVASDNGQGKIEAVINFENVHGSYFDDSIKLGLTGGYVFGRAGDDSITGNAGNDNIIAGSGDDVIDGGEGFDYVTYSVDGYDNGSGSADDEVGAVTVNLLTGTAIDNWGDVDTLTGIEHVQGSQLDDSITGDNSGNNLYGLDGDDTLLGLGGADNLYGGAGNDSIDGGKVVDTNFGADDNFTSYYYATAGVNINLSGISGDGSVGYGTATGNESVGTDILKNIHLIQGSAFNDTITGNSARIFQQFEGGAGNDVLDGGTIVDGNDSNRAVYHNTTGAGVVVDFIAGTAVGVTGSNAGADTISNFNQVRGSNFADTLLGSNRTDVTESFEGRAGNDYIDGRGGFDIVRYGNATSQVVVNLVTGLATGAMGNDTLVGIEGVRGGSGNDILTGGNPLNGVVYDDDLSETFVGEGGNDTIDGGQGYDRVDYTSSAAGVSVTLNDSLDGSASDGFGGTDVLRNIEALRGSMFGDVLTGSNTAIYESFEGREGNDTIDGKGGIDRADYQNSSSGVVVNLTTGLASDGYGDTDTLSNIEYVRGSYNSDSITGNASNNFFRGLDGDDTLNGAGGDDTLNGSEGNDSLVGGAGLDTASYRTATGAIIASLGVNAGSTGADGSDTYSSIENLTGSDYADALTGSASANRLLGERGNDTLNGADGDDTLNGGAGNDSLVGGAGIDTASYEYATGAVIASLSGTAGATGADGTDVLSGMENLVGSDYADSLTGSSTANSLEGGAGNDTLNGAAGADTLLGGTGDDQYTVDNTGDIVTESASAGTDTVLSSVSFVLGANVENLRLTASTAINGTGNNLANLITAGTGNNILDGAAGLDTVSYASSGAAVIASLTTRTATGGSGSDSILNFENIAGSNYGDSLTGNTLANQLDGAGGSDTLNGGTGADTLTGGSGSDTFFVENTGDLVIETGSDALSGTDTVYASISYTLTANVENLRINSTANINATGNEINNIIFAGAGNNIINGAAGIDTVHYGNTSAGVNISLATEAAQATGNSGTDTLISIENLSGSNYNDTLQGSNADNIIEGGTGIDTVSYANATAAVAASLASKSASGGGGNDTLLRIENLTGSSYSDTLTGSSVANILAGGAGKDSLNGSSGNDTLVGGLGADILKGGSGADTFDFDSLSETGLTSATWDSISDFSGASGDRIDLSTIDANTVLAGEQAFNFIGSASFTAAGQLRYDKAAGMLYGSVDADADAEFAIQLVGNPAFNADYLIA